MKSYDLVTRGRHSLKFLHFQTMATLLEHLVTWQYVCRYLEETTGEHQSSSAYTHSP